MSMIKSNLGWILTRTYPQAVEVLLGPGIARRLRKCLGDEDFLGSIGVLPRAGLVRYTRRKTITSYFQELLPEGVTYLGEDTPLILPTLKKVVFLLERYQDYRSKQKDFGRRDKEVAFLLHQNQISLVVTEEIIDSFINFTKGVYQ
jgi:hypothetical protein